MAGAAREQSEVRSLIGEREVKEMREVRAAVARPAEVLQISALCLAQRVLKSVPGEAENEGVREAVVEVAAVRCKVCRVLLTFICSAADIFCLAVLSRKVFYLPVLFCR